MSFPGRQSWVLLLLIVLVALLARRIVPARLARIAAWSDGPALPILAGILAASLTLWQWGGLHAEAVVYDESAYLLQAELLAAGHWALPSPPVHEAFTQSAVLVTPVLAPKMPPGHALALVPGLLLHAPGLVPVILVGLTGALLLLLVRKVAGAGAGTIAVALWLTQAGQARWRASYFSENTTTALCLLGWYALLKWRATRHSGWLILLGIVTGWGAITRPLTMIAFTIPVAIVVIADTLRSRQWGPLLAAVGIGMLPLLAIPLQNSMVLGSWNATPLGLYTRQYVPFDKMGFGLDSTAPLLKVPPFIAASNADFALRHREHQPAALPQVLAQRLKFWWVANFSLWRKLLAPILILGLIVMPVVVWVPVASGVLLYISYLLYAHQPYWTLYYAEANPVWAAVLAMGVAWLLIESRAPQRTTALGVIIGAGLLFWARPDLIRWRDANQDSQRKFLVFRRMLAEIPGDRILVFVRERADHDPHGSFVRNVADPNRARVIIAFDLGDAETDTIRKAFPDRMAFRWDEATNSVESLSGNSHPTP
ncbi:MAG: hypothetical protein V4558_08595 [Gemmatimonadota bacterium]